LPLAFEVPSAIGSIFSIMQFSADRRADGCPSFRLMNRAQRKSMGRRTNTVKTRRDAGMLDQRLLFAVFGLLGSFGGQVRKPKYAQPFSRMPHYRFRRVHLPLAGWQALKLLRASRFCWQVPSRLLLAAYRVLS